jgi:hypothetical protein
MVAINTSNSKFITVDNNISIPYMQISFSSLSNGKLELAAPTIFADIF